MVIAIIIIWKKNFETRVKKYGSINYYNIAKCKETKLKNHGSENYNNAVKCQTTKEIRYGDRNYNNIIKSKATKLRRYDNENYNSREKAKVTCIDRYGVEYTSQIPEVIEQRKVTCIEKYNVPYTCLLPSCKIKGNDGKPNKHFENILIKNNLVINEDYIREFVIEDRSYDFKLLKYNLLIEINPTATYNITMGVYKTEPKSSVYHFEKRNLANKYGYQCICIWDWDDQDKIVQSILNGLLTITLHNPIEHYVNLKNTDVIIVDDGQTLIY